VATGSRVNPIWELRAVSLTPMALRVACLHHLRQPYLGTAEAPLRDGGLELVEYDVIGGTALPDLDEYDGILSLGGDQSVCEIDCHPYLETEAELLREAHRRELPVLGVCLGAQLLAHALGGEVRHMAQRLLEWSELEPLPAAAHDPLGRALPSRIYGLHWNDDCFEPPPGAVELVTRSGEGCEAFRVGACAWGVQFHPDADAAVVEGWYAADADWFATRDGMEESARAADAVRWADQEVLAGAIFGAFARVVRESASSRAKLSA
jgi:GMP synthase (glutamine-hydrolysing)